MTVPRRALASIRAVAVAVAFVPVLVAVGCGSDAAAPTALVDIGAGVQGPSGARATVYATGLKNVAALAFDADGRLWTATAAFDDAGTDVVAVVMKAGATPTTVLRGQHTVLGLLWHDDELFVASKERVDAYGDFDGARFGSRRSVVTFPSGVGEVNGLAISADGRISLGISSPCNACEPETDESGAVVSFRPDGSGLRVDASGIRAAIGLAYRPGTDDLFVTMNHRDDLGDDTPGDWLAVVQRGQDWKFPACSGVGGAACAGTPEPVAELDPHAALSGVAFVDGGAYALVAEWTQGLVQRVAVRGTGTATTGTVSAFLDGIGQPVGVVTGPDGAVYVGDWKSGRIFRVALA